MPPRAKKPTAGPGPKKTARASKVTPKAAAQNPSEVGADEAVKAEEVKADEAVKAAEVKADLVVEVKDEAKAEDDVAVDDKNTTDLNVEPKQREKSEANGLIPAKKEDEVKETVDEYEKGEWLDLEDNEPEYEPEEYDGGVDYDEKEFDQEDGQEEGDEGMEEAEEGDVGEEEEGDIAEEGTEDVPEEFEGEEDDERAGEEHEHAELLDAEVEEENREVFKERRKRKEFEVFVGGLDKDATENDLRKVFSAVGEVVEIRLMMNPQTKKNKGFAFLRFATVEQAKRALTELKNPVVNGKQCGVTPSQDSDTLFLGNICKTWTKEALEKKLKHYGIEKIEDLTLVEDSNNPGMNRGFAFLEFSSRSDAMDAFKRLQKRDVVFGVDRPAKVSFADSFIDPGDEIMAQVKTVFVDGLPASWDEDRVREVLKKFGQIEKIELARNMTSARRKDFGFVTFDTHDAAVMCAKSINNADLGEGDAKAKVRVRLSRPLQRGKGKRATHGDHRGGHVVGRAPRAPWNRPLPLPRTFPARTVRGASSHIPPAGRSFKRPIGLRDRRPAIAMPARPRAFPPPPRPHDKRPPVPAYPKSSMTRGYPRREELPPRSRAAADYGPRATDERRPSYRDDYSARAVGYPELHRSTASRPAARRTYADDSYGPRYERPPPSYREGRARDYDSISGSKRPYSAMDDVPPRYTDSSVRNSRARLDYDLAGGASQYGDTYSDRLGRSNVGYSGSRSSISGQDTHGLYSTRSGMGYGGSYGSSDVGGVYSSSYGGDFVSRGSDVGGSSYSSLYASRGLGSSGHMGSGGSGSYY